MPSKIPPGHNANLAELTPVDVVNLHAKEPLSVRLTPAAAQSTNDQALWTAIRTSTDLLNFNAYREFIDRVFCRDGHKGKDDSAALAQELTGRRPWAHAFAGVDAYQMLKTATQAFLLIQCGIYLRKPEGGVYQPPPPDSDANTPVTDRAGMDEATRVGSAWTYEEAYTALSTYLGKGGTLPYLDRIVTALFPSADPAHPKASEGSPMCSRILNHRWSRPPLLELIWSYWTEEAMVVQTINSVALRFQNRRGPGERDSLAHLKLDPLRPLSNLLWGYVQDEVNRLTLVRRAYEYRQAYGLTLVGKAVPPLAPVEDRVKFTEAFNNLLRVCAFFFKEDDDMTVKSDAFPLLNALKEVHLILAYGAHNQFGDLTWTARVEMLIQKWLLARPELREYLGGAPMVAYPEAWMAQVETMKALQGWGDVQVNHHRDLSLYGEQILLSIRYGDWWNVNNPEQARNWARYWRPEIQSYTHSYRAATGQDLSVARSSVTGFTNPAVASSTAGPPLQGRRDFRRNGSRDFQNGRYTGVV
ncbi:MAG TPA: hypothetical protein PLX89_12645 [Verrucomicrobiota bacterium]|nr:hypothetical protein [Verrucomicrobiales bacterium]HRI13840.1 hypothetical protein [Verrucomicrobiota bacterium]